MLVYIAYLITFAVVKEECGIVQTMGKLSFESHVSERARFVFDHKFNHLEGQYSLPIKNVGSGARLRVFETQFSICHVGDIGHLSVPQFSQSKITHNYGASIRIKI